MFPIVSIKNGMHPDYVGFHVHSVKKTPGIIIYGFEPE